MKKLVAVVCVLAITSMVNAIGIVAVPYVGSDTSNTAQGLTPDGKYLVGTSGAANGYVFNAQTGNLFTMDRVSTGRLITKATGVGYRTSGGVDQLVVHGGTGIGWMGIYVAELSTEPGASGLWTTPDASVWLSTLAEAGGVGTGTYNSLAMEGLGSANGYGASIQGTGGAKVRKSQIVKIDSASSSYTSAVAEGLVKLVGGGVSATGVVTYGHNGHKNWTALYTPGGTLGAEQINSLIGTSSGDMYAMAADGSRAFGYNYAANTNAYAFDLDAGGNFTAAYQLPTPGATGTSLAYGASADGDFAVGKIYNGIDNAVLWNLTNTGSISVTDLTVWAAAHGALGTFTQLSRATSIGVDGSGNLVVSGIGVNAGATQAFVLTMPEPATLSFLAIGALALLRRRH